MDTAIVPHDRSEIAPNPTLDGARLPTAYLRWQFSKRDETSARKHLMVLGYLVLASYLTAFILPDSLQNFTRPTELVSAAIFLLTCAIRRDIKIPIVAPMVIALMLQTWSFITSVHASLYLGRPLGFARPETYILESAVPFFVTCSLIHVDKSARKTVPRLFLIPAAISTFFGYGQFARIPFFLTFAQLYTYKSIDFWDGHPGLRAVGLTFHPSCLAIQAGIAFFIIAVAARYRRLGAWEIFGLLYFSGGVLMTQDRTMYIPFALFWSMLVIWLIKNDRQSLKAVVGVAFAGLLVLVMLAPRRFGYLTQSTIAATTQNPALYPQHYYVQQSQSINNPDFVKEPDFQDSAFLAAQGSDAGLNYRQSLWKAQMQPIWPKYMYTGIGPSSGLLDGTGPEDKWVRMGHVMESGYLLMIAMYGLPGLVIFCGGLIVSFISCLRVAFDRTLVSDRQSAALLAAAAVLMIACGCSTANTVDNYMKVPLAWMLGGLAVKSTLDAWNRRR